ncbi:hypothetical protein QFC22_000243 [Naganishia vaughanmartiniae]|uniref:Uncharacterized protein n=1 Tax=Naganishia vaughanmartiniae TaxID=1424756 RepID=A0ACC2XMT0_9TREE|nr:hypothetical protein QFC22_000243 [Naganishia vaughanmartiniae]
MVADKESKEAALAAKNRILPAKEAALFKTLLQQYELKQYKKGIKAADQILKKAPNHGETLALKALILHSSLPHNHPTASSQPKGEEVDHLIAAALRKDPYTHITHHVNSIIARAKKDYATAGRSLTRAREIDGDNIPLIRDAISLHTQLGQHEESLRVRHQFFTMRPNLRSNWISLAVGHELCGNYQEALDVYLGLEESTKDEGLAPIEKTQMSWHIVKLMIKLGKLKEAHERLGDDIRDRIVPNSGETVEIQAELLQKMGQAEEAEVAYRRLIESNPDKIGNYKAMLKARGLDLDGELSAEQVQKVLSQLELFSESFPRAAAPKRLALDVAQGDDFNQRVRVYLQAGLEKGIPSLFVDLKGLYKDKAKLKVVESILEDLKQKLEVESTSAPDGEPISPPTMLLWLYYYLALHLAHPAHPTPDYARSLKLLETALEHTPTLPEIYMAKAMVLKRAGDPDGAARAMEQARLLDGQDRFLNGKAGKYWLRAGEVEKASAVFGLFTKKDAASPGQDLTDMQCTWFLQEEGDAALRAGRLPLAVKRYERIISIFKDEDDDQYDFHTYALRKMNLNAYFNMVEFGKQLRHHPQYIQAATQAADIYLRIYDNPDLREVKLSPEEEAERKKAAKKAQKANSKAKKAAAAPAENKEEPALPDADPEGKEYLKEVDALAAIERLLQPLFGTAEDEIALWLTSFELALRQDHLLQAIRALNKSHKLEPKNPRVHNQAIRLSLKVSSLPAETAHLSLIKSSLKRLIPDDVDLLRINGDFIQQNANSSPHIFYGALTLRDILLARSDNKALSDTDKQQVEGAFMQVLNSEVKPDIKTYQDTLTQLNSTTESSPETIAKFRESVLQRLPLALGFSVTEEKQKRKEQWAVEDAKENEVTLANGTA